MNKVHKDTPLSLSTIAKDFFGNCFNELPIGIIVLRDEEILLNKFFEKFIGYTNQEITNIDQLWRLLHIQNKNKLKTLCEKKSTDEPSMFSIKTKTGKIKYLEFRAYHVDGHVKSYVTHDITQKHIMFENMPLGMFLCDRNGKIITFNSAFLKMIGYSADEMLQLTCWDITPEKYLSIEQKIIAEQFIGNEDMQYGPYEKEFIHKNGHVFPVSMHGMWIRNANNEKQIWSIVENVAEHHNIAEKLHISKAKLDLTSKIADLGLWMWNVQTNETEYDERWANILGYELDEVTFNLDFFLDHLLSEDRPILDQKTIEHLQGKSDYYQCTFRMLTKRGDIRWILSRGRISKYDENGNPLIALGSHLDITKIKTTENELEETKHLLNEVMDYSPVAIFAKDLHGRHLYINKNFREFLNLTEPEIIGKTDFDIHSKKAARMFRKNDLKIIKEIKSIEFKEHSKTKDGCRHISQSVKFPLITPEGKLYGTGGISLDITEKTLAVEEKERLQRQLQHAQKIDALGRLAGGVAHDFNNILTGILGHASILKTKIPDISLTKNLEVIEKSAERGAQLTQQLLGFARKGQYEKRFLNLNSLIAEACGLLHGTINKNICIRTDLEPELWAIEGDSSQLLQVLINVGLNARDAMPEGGMLLISTNNISSKESHVLPNVLANTPQRDYVHVSIVDTGAGIDPSIQEKNIRSFFYY